MNIDVAKIYNKFPHFDEFRFAKNDNLAQAKFRKHSKFDGVYEDCANDIKNFIKHKNREKRFGFNLLHKHFKLESGEIFLEQWIYSQEKEKYIHVTQPVKLKDYKDQIIFTQWIKYPNAPIFVGLVARKLKEEEKVEDSLAQIIIPDEKVEYPPKFESGKIKYPEIDEIPQGWEKADMEFLWSIGSALERKDVDHANKFGIYILPKEGDEQIYISKDEDVLIEWTDEEKRINTREVIPISKAIKGDRKYVYTNWRVEEGSTNLIGLAGCRYIITTGQHVKDID